MALGDIYEATAADSRDLYYVDMEMYDTPEYGPVYILDAERPAVVDTGIGRHPDVVIDALAELGIAPEDLAVIAPTHVHLDHAGGAGHLAAACPNAEVAVHENGAPHLIDPGRLWEGTKAAVGDEIRFYGRPEPVPENRLVELSEGDVVDLGDHVLEVYHAPGHAPHQTVFYDPANDGVFTADAAGILTPALDAVQPTTPPANFDLEQSLADVELLEGLDPAALYYGHFGDYETADRLETYPEVLADWVADVEV
ncbi:MAG: MBL fold metallo-hydrolase, partial [Haloarculaceae archaeon]